MQMEEEGLGDDLTDAACIPEAARVQVMSFNFCPDWRAYMKFRRRGDRTDGSFESIEECISW